VADNKSELVRKAAKEIVDYSGSPLLRNDALEALANLLNNLADAMAEHEEESPVPGLTNEYCADEELAIKFAELIM
jgi:hypothetical protein